MQLRTLHDWASSQFKFPVTKRDVVAEAGDKEIEAPEPSESETVATILDRSGESRFGSPRHLEEVIRGNVSEAYIGRKFYDDRGSDPRPNANGSREVSTYVSF